ncbi:SDR family NAD(P)-dependent oxidoreductase [Balneolales bacterium ANBcel1]|nr:SDR family NAD(P)-dependent oxidoreductase [Balneolales bacterium ANBcel1]
MKVLVLGGNSEIGLAAAEQFAQRESAEIILASRNLENAEKHAAEIAAKYGVAAEGVAFDATDFDSHRSFYNRITPAPDVVIQAFGVLVNQKECQADFDKARLVLDGNLAGAVSILEIIAADFEQRGSGTIIGLSSVAGERGRKSSYIYASAKAGLTVYLDGLRHRLHPTGVRVITVLPGFVPTKMVAGRTSKFGVTPLHVAGKDIYNAWKRGRYKIYTGRKMRWVMAFIRNIPEPVMLKMRNL